MTSRWLANCAERYGDQEAVYDVGTGRRWTYGELAMEAQAWAGRLAAEGIQPGDRVAVLALNRVETLALLFAAGQLGAILFVMNWRLSPAELAWQLSDCTPSVLVHDDTHADLASKLGTPRLSLEEGGGHAPLEYWVVLSADAPWQLMYTSGSTGRPKGALLTHSQINHNARITVSACMLDSDCSTLTFTPLFHTGGMNCLTTPLLRLGGRVVLMPRLDAAEALALIENEQITHLMGVPTIFQLLADHPSFVTTQLGRVRDAICGGAPLGLALLNRWLSRNITLRQGFGLTEVGPNCFSMPSDQVRNKAGSVGLPIVDAKLVRDDGTLCKEDEPGELFLSGPSVFGGYWGKPSPLVDGWFGTGDVLSRDIEGYYSVRGRKKEMYISGGENVYPAEVEAVLSECPDVAAAAVIGVPDDHWGEVGHAFVEPTPGSHLDEPGLKAFLSGRLAHFKQPKHYTLNPHLPRTGSGKLDKSALAQHLR